MPIKITIEDPNSLLPHEVVAINAMLSVFPNLQQFYAQSPTPAAEPTPAPTPATPATDPDAYMLDQEFGGDKPDPNETSNPAEIDRRGFPWDERIHSAGRTMNKDGTWRTKRGVSDDEIAAVEAELAAQFGNTPATETPVEPAQPSTPAVPAAPDAPLTPDQHMDQLEILEAQRIASGTQAAPAAPAAPQEPFYGSAPVAPGVPTTFPAFMAEATSRWAASDIVTAARGAGLETLPQLASRLDLIEKVYNALVASHG